MFVTIAAMGGIATALCAFLLGGCGRFAFDERADGRATLACPSFASMCESFESGDLQTWTSTKEFGLASVTVSTTRTRSGTFALDSRVAADTDEGGAAAPLWRMPARDTGVLAMRQWINLAMPLIDFNLVGEFRNPANGEYLTVGGDSSGRWVSTHLTEAGVLDDHFSTVATPSVDTWVCVELVIVFAQAGPARVQVYVDDAQVIDTDIAEPSPIYSDVLVGVVRADRAGFHVFVDDVVVADRRITCE